MRLRLTGIWFVVVLMSGLPGISNATAQMAAPPPAASSGKPPETDRPAANKPVSSKQQSANETMAVVRAFYESAPDPANLPFSGRLAKLHAAAMARSGEVGAPVAGLDFAFHLNAPDAENGYRKTLRLAQIRNDGKRARVRATMRNYRPVELWFDLLREDGQWRVDEVQSRRDPRWMLSRLYIAGAKEK